MLVRRERIFGTMAGMLLVLVPLALEVVGCNKAIRPAEWPELRTEGRPKELRVVPKSNKEVADVSANDIVRVMRQVGLSDEQIFNLGTELHDALLASGAAEIMYGGQSLVRVTVSGEYLFVRSRSQGTLVYDIARGRFGLVPPPPKEGF